MHITNPISLAHLLAQWRLAALLGWLGWGLALVSVGVGLGWQNAARWLLLPTLGMLYIFWFLRRYLGENHTPEQALLPSLGWGNALTLSRAVIVACLSGFLLLPQPGGGWAWGVGLLYTLATLLDFFDGYVARITGHASALGARLDMEFDSWGLLLAALLAVKYGQAPGWYVLVGLARYLFLAGMALRTRRGLVNYPLATNTSRRLFAGMQLGLSFVLLWPLYEPPVTHWAATLISLPHLLGFAKDWLLTCGWLKPGIGASWQTRIAVAAKWLPLSFRLAAAAMMLALLPGLPPGWAVWGGGVSVLIALGIAPRLAALAGLFAAGLLPANGQAAMLMVFYAAILYLGGGLGVLWQPEARLFAQRVGEVRRA
jgi:CDP-diacylglycerol--glycerol-3-phosphate 3-phosphatidyltransferase